MKKWLTSFLVVSFLFSVIIFWGCGGKKADLKGASALLSLIPEEAAGILSVNFKKLTRLDIFDKLITDMKQKKPESTDEFFTSYQDFIDKTGIDPKTDLYSLVIGLFGDVKMMRKSREDVDKDLVVVIDLKYSQDKILNIIKKRGVKFTEEKYNNAVLYKFTDKQGQLMTLTFINEKTIAFGRSDRVKKVVDLSAGKGKNVFDNEKKKSYLDELRADAVVSFIFDFPEELKSSQQQEGSPFKMDLSKAESLLGYIDFDGSAWSGELKLISFNEEGNKQIVTLLNGLKGMGALAGPEVAELISNIQLTSGADHIKLTFSLSNELLEKLREKAKEKKKGFKQFDQTKGQSTE